MYPLALFETCSFRTGSLVDRFSHHNYHFPTWSFISAIHICHSSQRRTLLFPNTLPNPWLEIFHSFPRVTLRQEFTYCSLRKATWDLEIIELKNIYSSAQLHRTRTTHKISTYFFSPVFLRQHGGILYFHAHWNVPRIKEYHKSGLRQLQTSSKKLSLPLSLFSSYY